MILPVFWFHAKSHTFPYRSSDKGNKGIDYEGIVLQDTLKARDERLGSYSVLLAAFARQPDGHRDKIPSHHV